MSKKRIEQMLQDCLDGYEAGLTPEECLSAYNGDRAALEPLLRQALSLRVAYASTPSDEFRREARRRLMFAAGQDVSQALASTPDPEFVARGRVRFLNAAGAAAQEALRDVPPPRLAFWVNARRRLLESAAAPRPSRRFVLAMRYGLSAAVVVIALAVATLAPFTDNSPKTADALAALEQQITKLEGQEQVNASELLRVTRGINAIADTLDDQPAPEVAHKLEGLTARSEALSLSASKEPELTQAQEELEEAQTKLRVFAASVITPEPTQAAALVAPTEEPSASPTAEATQKPAATTTAVPAPPRTQVRTAISKDKAYGLEWLEVKTGNTTFLMPSSWRLLNVNGDENGILSIKDSFLGVDTGGAPSVMLVIVPTTGQVNAAIAGTSLPLRSGGADAQIIAPDALAKATELAGVDEEVVLALHHFVLSMNVTGP
jgi:hypothetical protein